jgi:hypothetical protein
MENESTAQTVAPQTAVTDVAQKNLVQWNLRVPAETRDLIIKKATGDYAMSVPDFVVAKCLDTLPVKTMATGAEISEPLPAEHTNFDTENDALNGLVRRLNAQILGLVAENQELKEKLNINATAPAVEPAAVVAENEFTFIVSPELKETLNNIDAHRTEKNLTPALKESLEHFLLPWAEDKYSSFDFTKNTGIDFSDFKNVLKIQSVYVNQFLPTSSKEVVEKK